ncbi:MAG TPA: CcdB family protein [Sphingomicrobium sp.]|nr:CcdB family protein [Sphingomicrobium sp.]
MAQFDVYEMAGGNKLVIDCQSDLLSFLESRFVAPLVAKADAPKPGRRLNPIFSIEGVEHVMLAQYSAAIDRRQLGAVVVSLADRSFEITDALDVLISGV